MFEPVIKVIDLIPGDVQPLTVIQSECLSEAQFWEQYVCRHTPVLIKGAVAAWPAVECWQRPGYLESLCGHETVTLLSTFNAHPPISNPTHEQQPLLKSIAAIRAASENQTLSVPGMAVPQKWLGDIGEYPFLQKHDRPPLGYPRRRMFFYKNASTEWHYHQLDETLTCQLVGSKRISLFRLTRANWSTFAPLIKANYHHMRCAERFFATDTRLTKYEGIIESGDAIYIPPFWWHGVDSVDSSPGITLAHCFRSPLRRFGDWQDPVTRELVADALRFSKVRLVPLLTLIFLSSVIRTVRQEGWMPA